MNDLQIFLTITEIVISAIALYFAIRIPTRIAKEQNKIALLENRTRVYLDFVDLFNSTISWPITLTKALGTNIKKVSMWDRDIKIIFTKAELLFSSSLKNDLESIKELYLQIRRYDELIEIGLANIGEDDKNRILKLFMEDSLYGIDDKEMIELKKLTEQYSLDYNECVGEDEYEYIHINLYQLSSEQKTCEKEAINLQNVILEKMKKETCFN